MYCKGRIATLVRKPAISWFDLAVLVILLLGGVIYCHDATHWGIAYIGDAQYGDAEFWWNGAVHVGQGIFQDNPGKGFRPGYFILTGLTLPVLGQQFTQFYPYFLAGFLATTAFFYLALRQSLGRWASACVVGMLVFNPFTAEWLSTSTTDSTGLLLSLAALSCLLLGLNKGLQNAWLVAFGIFFALVTLTRPLVTPFIGVVLLILLTMPQESFKKRLVAAVCILMAFALPTLLWVAAQKFTINEWTLSSNEASPFYAASDPDTQVWNPTMYAHVQQLAAEYNHIETAKVDDKMINQIFWQETLKNYIKYPGYHLRRIVPHLVELASFTPKIAAHGTDFWRKAFLAAIAIGMSLGFIFQRCWGRALILAILGLGVCLWPPLATFMTLAGAGLALMSWGRNGQRGILLLSAYWLTGIAALYFVGGTFGVPSFSNRFALSALGYRLGTQIFFVGDLLAAYFLVWWACIRFNETGTIGISAVNNFCRRWWQFLVCRVSSVAGGVVLVGFGLFCIVTLIIYTVGSGIVIQRAYAYLHAPARAFPQLDSITTLYFKQNGSLPQQIFTLKKEANSSSRVKLERPQVFTGAASAFIWNLPGQERAQLLVYPQAKVYPFTMGAQSIILEIPQHISAKDWVDVQGAFVIDQVPNKHNISNLPYYLSVPAIRAFIPLTADKRQFALEKAIWFPLVKNAAQLETDGELRTQNAQITWALDSGQEKFQRRFFVVPLKKSNGLARVELMLDVASVRSPAKLSFSYTEGSTLGVPLPLVGYYEAEIYMVNKIDHRRILLHPEPQVMAERTLSLRKLELSVPSSAEAIVVAFNKLKPDTGIWIYEFNLSASNFEHSEVKS